MRNKDVNNYSKDGLLTFGHRENTTLYMHAYS